MSISIRENIYKSDVKVIFFFQPRLYLLFFLYLLINFFEFFYLALFRDSSNWSLFTLISILVRNVAFSILAPQRCMSWASSFRMHASISGRLWGSSSRGIHSSTLMVLGRAFHLSRPHQTQPANPIERERKELRQHIHTRAEHVHVCVKVERKFRTKESGHRSSSSFSKLQHPPRFLGDIEVNYGIGNRRLDERNCFFFCVAWRGVAFVRQALNSDGLSKRHCCSLICFAESIIPIGTRMESCFLSSFFFFLLLLLFLFSGSWSGGEWLNI